MADTLSQAEVENLIEQAFADITLPAQGALCVTGSEEDIKLRSNFANKPWQEITLQDLLKNIAILFYLTNEAYQYFLPTCMLFTMRVDPKKQLPFQGVMISLLETTNIEDDFTLEGPEFYRKRVTGFNQEQKAAIKAFLEYTETYGSDSVAWTAKDALQNLGEVWGDM